MRPKISPFVTNDKILNKLFSVSFKPLLDLLYPLPRPTPRLATGSLELLIATAASRASMTFGSSRFKTLMQTLEERLNVDICPAILAVPPLYEISAFLNNLEIDAVLKAIQESLKR